MPHEHERRAAAKTAAERQRVGEFAASLRRRAHQQAYAGFDGDYVANAVCAAMESVVLHWDTVPTPVRQDLLKAARYHFDGPSGLRDPRGDFPALSDGPGY